MAKLTLTDLSQLDVADINANFALIEDAFNSVLSTNSAGTGRMDRALDMNSNRVLNLPTAVNGTEPVTLAQATTLAGVTTPLTQENIGGALYPRTAGEITAGVTPTNYFYPPGDVRRYGAVGNGAVDDSPAINVALSVDQAVKFPLPPGSYLVASGIRTTFGAVRIEGDGIETRIRTSGQNHTFTVQSGNNDAIIDGIWFDHLGTGPWDAIHSLGTETRIRYVDVDYAPRYGIYVGGFRTQIHQSQFQGVLDTGIYILNTARFTNITDVNFVIAGDLIPGKCIDVQSDFNTISGVIADQCSGYVLSLAGNYNVASNITGRLVGGTTAEDFVRVAGSANTVTGASIDNCIGRAFFVSGSANQLRGCVTTDSSGSGLVVTGNDNSFQGRVFNAGLGAGSVSGVSVEGNGNVIDVHVADSSGSDISVTGDFNTITGQAKGAVVISATSEGNAIDLHCSTLSVAQAAAENKISAVATGNTGTVVSIASNGNLLEIRSNEGGSIGVAVSGSKNVGCVSSFGASDACVEVDGSYNSLNVYASGSSAEDVRVGGDHNTLQVAVEGHLVIDGSDNVILGNVGGNVTFGALATNNILYGRIDGAVTDNGSGNNVTELMES